MSAWLVVAVVGVGTYLFRISMVGLTGRPGSSARFERASRFVVPSAFAALAAGAITAACVGAGPSGSVAPLGAVTVAALAVHRSGSARAAIVVGLPTLWVLNALLPG